MFIVCIKTIKLRFLECQGVVDLNKNPKTPPWKFYSSTKRHKQTSNIKEGPKQTHKHQQLKEQHQANPAKRRHLMYLYCKPNKNKKTIFIEKHSRKKTRKKPYFTLNYKENSGFPDFFLESNKKAICILQRRTEEPPFAEAWNRRGALNQHRATGEMQIWGTFFGADLFWVS